ncbi:MAG: hypothetical protein WC959_00980 [Kiritimatiellales bacterium]
MKWFIFTISLIFYLSASAIRITDTVSGTILFDNNGFENDVIGIKPSRVTVGKISTREQDKVIGKETSGPGAFQGTQYAITSRGPDGSGTIEIRLKSPIRKTDQSLSCEWAWYIPAGSDASWGLRGEDNKFKSLWRANDGSFKVFVDKKWEYKGYYATDEWMECKLDYTFGDKTAVLTVGGGAPIKLEVDTFEGGAREIAGFFFKHNANTSYYLDGLSK